MPAHALQRSIDEEWEALGPLVAHRPRPYSALHERLQRLRAASPAQDGIRLVS